MGRVYDYQVWKAAVDTNLKYSNSPAYTMKKAIFASNCNRFFYIIN